MTTHDEQLIARDSDIPGLRTVLDPQAYAATLRACDAPFDVRGARMTYIRYKPGRSCLVGYEVETGDGTHHVHTKAYRSDESVKLANAYERFSERGKSTGGGRIDAERMILHTFFPHDARLRAMRRLKTPDDAGHLLRDLFVRRSPLRRGTLDTIRYKPERRYVGRLDTDGVPAAVVKFYTDSAFEGLLARATAFHDAGPLRLPALVGHSERYRGLAFEWLGGGRLTEAMLDGSADPRTTHRLGLALALLHAQNGDGLPVRAARDEQNQLAAIGRDLAFLLPEHAGFIDEVVGRVRDALSRHNRTVRPMHGDFYAKQVLVQDDTIQLLDFDESALDDPLIDVGNFVAHLDRDRLRSSLRSDAMTAYRESFLEGYRETAPLGTADAWPLFAAAGLLKLAPHPFRFQEPDWPERVMALLEAAECYVAVAGPAPLRATAPAAAIDPDMPYLADALDPVTAAEALPGSAPIREARLVRHKKGRRCLIAYAFTDGEWLGKIRAKGLDEATFTLQQRLWEGAFGPCNADVGVAEPIGVVPAFNMWVQRREAGEGAAERLTQPDGEHVAERIAHALAALHRDGVPVTRTHTVADELDILSTRLDRLAAERPDWASRLARVRDACADRARTLATPAVGPIHRDFYADNLLVDGRRIVLLDLDLYAMGDPALDAGNFIAHLLEQGLREARDASHLAAQAAMFQDAYLHHAPSVACRSVETYTTLALARHIHISTLFPERRCYTEIIIRLCEARLGLNCPVALAHPVA